MTKPAYQVKPAGPTASEPLQGILKIDGKRINDAADRIGDFAHVCQLAVEAAVKRGIVIELFGFPIPIRLGPKPPAEDTSK